MDAHSQEQVESTVQEPRSERPRDGGNKTRSVYPCNFRSAGRLSNENARALTAIHESFAKHLASSLEAYLGTQPEDKAANARSTHLQGPIANVPPFSYVSPFYLSTIPGTMLVECGIDLVFPTIELLLGGSGMSVNEARELSEIEEELMQEPDLADCPASRRRVGDTRVVPGGKPSPRLYGHASVLRAQ